jgi:hypothetical protein
MNFFDLLQSIKKLPAQGHEACAMVFVEVLNCFLHSLFIFRHRLATYAHQQVHFNFNLIVLKNINIENILIISKLKV